ncbi:MAG TPA: response regulator [Pyrinomonadaceae bacterium]|nr:response regulator [Pyrinomonadaceae bacterium]
MTTRIRRIGTTSRYLSDYFIVRFFMLAAGPSEKPLDPDAERLNRIREQGYKILVIDDDDDFRKSFCFKLRRKYKAEVEDVVSGEEGVKKMSDGHRYDFIFTDIMMPAGMSGVEAYHKLREIDAETPIVIMSAYSDSEGWKEAQQLGVPLLHKPISDGQLDRILDA